MTENAGKRPVRMCDACGGVDDHPRHVHGTAVGESNTTPDIVAKALDNVGSLGNDLDRASARLAVLGHVQDSSTQMKHLDCCAADGCPDGTCQLTVQGADGKTGDAMLKHVQSKATVERVSAYVEEREKDYISRNEATQAAAAKALAEESAR